jgi:hypothetical protein
MSVGLLTLEQVFRLVRFRSCRLQSSFVVVACEYEHQCNREGFYYVNVGSGGGSITVTTGYAV